MSFIKTKSLGINSAREFIDSISTPEMNVNVYIAISHVDPWANDSAPETPIDNIETKVKLWRSMIGGKKITGYDMSLAIPRYDWTSGTIYTPYRSSGNTIFGEAFYVLTDDFNVYKCLDNNNGGQSTVKPTYTSADRTVTLSDGYTWKYMYTVSSSDQTRFLTDHWIPVKTLTLDDGSQQWHVQQAAVDGSISFVSLTANGSSYNANASAAVTGGDGVNAALLANVNTATQVIQSVVVQNPGSGYHYANVSITPSANASGSGANATAIISPFGGHGFDPVEELGGSNVIINALLVGNNQGTLTVNNDYRQIILLKNPLVYGSNNQVFANSVFQQGIEVSVGVSGGDYLLDEYVFQGSSVASSTFAGVVVDWDSGNNVLELAQTSGALSAAALVGATSGTVRFVINSTTPDIQPYSGKVLYVDNIQPITRSLDQTEDIQIVLSF